MNLIPRRLKQQINDICNRLCAIEVFENYIKDPAGFLYDLGLKGDEAEYAVAFLPRHSKEIRKLLEDFDYEIKKEFYTETCYLEPVQVLGVSQKQITQKV